MKSDEFITFHQLITFHHFSSFFITFHHFVKNCRTRQSKYDLLMLTEFLFQRIWVQQR